MNRKRFLLASLVLASISQLHGCGVTAWQRDQDSLALIAQHMRELASPEMARAIEEARR